MLEFLLAYWRLTGNTRFYEIVAHTMRAMARGGMYDHVEGGFFRYSTTRDWTVPHFEKMAEDHAGLLRVLAQLELWAPSEARARRSRAHDRLRAHGAARSADRIFRRQPGCRRRVLSRCRSRNGASVTEPFVDRRSYSNWTAGLAGAFAWCGLALDDRSLHQRRRLLTLDAMHERLRDDDGLLYHVASRRRRAAHSRTAHRSGRLRARACSTRTKSAVRRACSNAHARMPTQRSRAFGAPDGGFYDRADRDTLGRLEIARSADHRERRHGREPVALERDCCTSRGYREHRRAYAAALRKNVRARRVVLGGLRARACALRRAGSHRAGDRRRSPQGTSCAALPANCPHPFVAVSSDPEGQLAAYLCLGTACAAPVSRPKQLDSAYASLA